MKRMSAIFLTMALVAVLSGPASGQDLYDNCVVLADNYDLRLLYSVIGNSLNIATVSNSIAGFHAVGVYPTGNPMHPPAGLIADFWVTSGQTVTDINLAGFAAAADNNNLQNPTVIAGDQYLTSKFTRSLVTGDALGDVDIVLEQDIDVVYSCNGLTPAAGAQVPKHADDCYGQKTIKFSATPGTQTCPTAKGSYSDSGFKLDFEFTPSFDAITFTMSYGTPGWVGFGWTEGAAAHVATDMYVGWVDAAGTPTVVDAYSNQVGAPPPDASQDVTNILGTDDGKTTMTFTRALTTLDANDLAIKDQDVVIQWAYNDADGTGQTFPGHDPTQRSSGTVNFYNVSKSGGGGGGMAGPIDPIVIGGVAAGVFAIAGFAYYRNKKGKGAGPVHNEGYRAAPMAGSHA